MRKDALLAIKRLFTYIVGILIVVNFINIKSYALPGMIVYDPTAVQKMIEQIEQYHRMYEQAKAMVEAIGHAKDIPEVLNYLESLYSKCGNSKFYRSSKLSSSIPLNLCGDPKNIYETQTEYYRNRYQVKADDSFQERDKKIENKLKDMIKVNEDAWATTDQIFQDPPILANKVSKLRTGVRTSSNLIAVSKINAEINISLLEELGEIKQLLARQLKMESMR